jgi:hypothetical protein
LGCSGEAAKIRFGVSLVDLGLAGHISDSENGSLDEIAAR